MNEVRFVILGIWCEWCGSVLDSHFILNLATHPEFSLHQESAGGHRNCVYLRRPYLWVSAHPRTSVTTAEKRLPTRKYKNTDFRPTLDDMHNTCYDRGRQVHACKQIVRSPLCALSRTHFDPPGRWFLAFSLLCLLGIALETELVWSHLSAGRKEAFVN